ncbi:Hypothetical_protein [Hexamita inflata]|uniref:Hypothetical_protein n=1 Tax=Hexamita inflata TaxID=28002 RepID=A0AA86TCL8_9EUKA|nr:Hypothetical protein HINF_LOCUS1770 [Hexamita inflata]
MKQAFIQAALQILNITPQNNRTAEQYVKQYLTRCLEQKYEAVWYDLSFVLNVNVAEVKKFFLHQYLQPEQPRYEPAYTTPSMSWNSQTLSSVANWSLELNQPENVITVTKVEHGQKTSRKALLVRHPKFSQDEIAMVLELARNNRDLSASQQADLIQKQLQFRKQIRQFTQLLKLSK